MHAGHELSSMCNTVYQIVQQRKGSVGCHGDISDKLRVLIDIKYHYGIVHIEYLYKK